MLRENPPGSSGIQNDFPDWPFKRASGEARSLTKHSGNSYAPASLN